MKKLNEPQETTVPNLPMVFTEEGLAKIRAAMSNSPKYRFNARAIVGYRIKPVSIIPASI